MVVFSGFSKTVNLMGVSVILRKLLLVILHEDVAITLKNFRIKSTISTKNAFIKKILVDIQVSVISTITTILKLCLRK